MLIRLMVGGCLMLMGVAAVYAEVNVFGKAHLSLDGGYSASRQGVALSSNASNIGFGGFRSLSRSFRVVWQFDSEIDLTGEQGEFRARDRYIGLVTRFGTVIVGNHDTPNKLVGAQVEYFPNSIADRRVILGNGNGEELTDVRAKNAVMLILPRLGKTQIRLLASPGQDQLANEDTDSLYGLSMVRESKVFLAGLGFESNNKLGTSNTRFVSGFKFRHLHINAIVEQLDSDQSAKRDRIAWGLSMATQGKKLVWKAQAFRAEPYTGEPDSAGTLYALGLDRIFSQRLQMYLLAMMVDNSAGLTGGVTRFSPGFSAEVGAAYRDKFIPSAGEDVFASAAGIIFKF